MSIDGQKRVRNISPAEVRDARETVRRFLANARVGGRFESLSDGTALAPPGDEELRMLAQRVAQAASADPLAFAILGAKRSEHELRTDMAGAFAAGLAPGAAPQLSAAQRSALEAISVLIGRPALLVQNDDFKLPANVWELLVPYRADLRKMLRAVGRLELSGAAGTYAGTAFVVGPGRVMTNRHVLKRLATPREVDAEGKPIAWNFVEGISLVLNFKREFGSTDSAEFRVTGIATIFPDTSANNGTDVDLALLTVEQTGSAGLAWPAPVRIQSDPAQVRTGAWVCVAGYPDADETRNDQVEMDKIYGGVYQVKRLAPGTVTSVDPVHASLSHDCSTLAGNSGSCVFDLVSNSVIGLHRHGDYLQPNHAVMLPALFTTPPDPRLLEVNFQGG